MHTTLMRISAMVATLAAAALLAVGCGDDSSSSSSEGSGGSTSTEEATPAASTEGDGLALRITLDRLLGEHMILASNATQKALLGSKDVEAALGALEANTTELSGAIGSVYGDDAESAFQEQWAAHNGLFVNYTTAVAKDDAKGKASAVKGLGEYQEEFGAFLAEATGLPAGAVQEQLGIHVTHTAKGVDAFAAKDYATAYQQQRIGFDHMFAVGDILATSIAEQQELDSPAGDAADLQVTLDRLLSEHALLAATTMQRGIDDSADFKASAASLDANTDDLGDAIGSVYGADAQKAFETQWRAHIGFFVDYVTATAAKDDAAKIEAKEALDGYQESFAKFLATATGLDEDAAAESLGAHVEQLIGAFDAYAEGDYEAAYEQAREAYAHMYMTGEALAGAIAEQQEITNDGGAESGGGDTETMSHSGGMDAMGSTS